jgi:predicted PurR-regulated permease PerM
MVGWVVITVLAVLFALIEFDSYSSKLFAALLSAGAQLLLGSVLEPIHGQIS